MVQFPGPGGSNRSYGMGARQIYESLREQILRGVYDTGSQLPSSRGLAEELGVSRTTVTAAYEQLAAEGFIDVRQGARHRVASSLIGPELTANPPK
ncbi:MAG: winged helix-turn-helix transcriptional regulator, partial [Mesorhizobium sp.]